MTLVNVNWSLSPSLLSGQVDAVIGAFRNFELNQMDLAGHPGRAFYVEEEGVPPYDELILVANRASLAMRIVGPVETGPNKTRRDDTTPDALSGRALRAIGFIGLSVCVILHNLCAIGLGLTSRITWRTADPWITGPWHSSFGYDGFVPECLHMVAAIVLLICGVRGLRRSSCATAG